VRASKTLIGGDFSGYPWGVGVQVQVQVGHIPAQDEYEIQYGVSAVRGMVFSSFSPMQGASDRLCPLSHGEAAW
jgi:hypothetical protein